MINSYGQFVPDYPGQQYYQDPAYIRYMGQQQVQARTQQTGGRTVEVAPADSVQAAQDFPVAAGSTQILIGRDDSFIVVKSVSMAGQVTVDVYDKRPPEPPVKAINPADYVRRDEISEIVERAIREAERDEHPGQTRTARTGTAGTGKHEG